MGADVLVDQYRDTAARLAAHIRAITAAGDSAAMGATVTHPRGTVAVDTEAWRAYRQATIDAGLALAALRREMDDL